MRGKDLSTLGLSEEESQIYLMLLEYGTSSVSNISRITKIGRVNCYHHIEKLIHKGLLSESRRSKVKEFTAESPKMLINQQIESLNFAKSVVPELLAISAHNPKKPKIQFFEGKEGIKNVFNDMIKDQPEEIVSFSNFEQLAKFLPDFIQNLLFGTVFQLFQFTFGGRFDHLGQIGFDQRVAPWAFDAHGN